MDGSILADIREICDVGRDTIDFDGQLIPLINTFLFRSAQFGVGKKGFMIRGMEERWEDFIDQSAECFAALKSYIGLRVRLIFDPPDSSALVTALMEEAKELEWCLYNEADII